MFPIPVDNTHTWDTLEDFEVKFKLFLSLVKQNQHLLNYITICILRDLDFNSPTTGETINNLCILHNSFTRIIIDGIIAYISFHSEMPTTCQM